MILNKETCSRMCANAGMQPAKRMKFKDREIFVADGFSDKPEFTYRKFGVEPKDFPNGAFCTIWFVAKSEEFFEVGSPLLFDKFHDPHIEISSRQRARINRAVEDAQDFINLREKVRLDA